MSTDNQKSELKASLRLLKEKYLDKVSSSKYNQKLKDLISEYQNLSLSLKNTDLSTCLAKLQKKLKKLQKKLPKYVVPHSSEQELSKSKTKKDKKDKKDKKNKRETKAESKKDMDKKKVVVFAEDQNEVFQMSSLTERKWNDHVKNKEQFM
jgi:hypothetical protein